MRSVVVKVGTTVLARGWLSDSSRLLSEHAKEGWYPWALGRNCCRMQERSVLQHEP
jgi:hypothetical protein